MELPFFLTLKTNELYQQFKMECKDNKRKSIVLLICLLFDKIKDICQVHNTISKRYCIAYWQ